MEKSTKFLFLGAFDWVVHIRQPDVHVFLISFAIIALKFYRFLFLKNFRSQPQTTRFSVHFVFLWSQFCFIAFHWVLFFLRLSFCIIIAKEISFFSSINIFRIVTHVKLFGYIATVIWWGSATLPAFFLHQMSPSLLRQRHEALAASIGHWEMGKQQGGGTPLFCDIYIIINVIMCIVF